MCSSDLALRSVVSASTLPLRYARVELCAVLGRRAEAIEQLRTWHFFMPWQRPSARAVASHHGGISVFCGVGERTLIIYITSCFFFLISILAYRSWVGRSRP